MMAPADRGAWPPVRWPGPALALVALHWRAVGLPCGLDADRMDAPPALCECCLIAVARRRLGPGCRSRCRAAGTVGISEATRIPATEWRYANA
jgi:hypothetical protein